MRYVVDTHALVWYLSRDARLGSSAQQILSQPDQLLLIPVIVLAETKHAADRHRVSLSFATVAQTIASSPRITVIPMDLAIVQYLPAQLDIHDAMIVATALYYQDTFQEDVAVLTNDIAITNSGLITAVWS
ncbi:MAG: PIN domain-containing protein [Chloroflexota bacterium]